MVRSLEARPTDAHHDSDRESPYQDPLGGVPLPDSGPVRDQDTPLFALLRSTLGLPDDARWWPARPVRRPGWFATSGGLSPASTGTSRPASWVIGGVAVPVVGIAPPTLTLLERTLTGLRAWALTPSPESALPLGHHAKAVSRV